MKLPLHIVSPKQNAQIISLISDGTISRASGRELLEIITVMNVKWWNEQGIPTWFLCKFADKFDEVAVTRY
jgi:hypothetical protein